MYRPLYCGHLVRAGSMPRGRVIHKTKHIQENKNRRHRTPIFYGEHFRIPSTRNWPLGLGFLILMNFCRMRETKKFGRNSPQIVVPNQIKIFVRNKSDATRCANFLSSRATSCVSELLKISHACRMRSIFFGPHKVAPTWKFLDSWESLTRDLLANRSISWRP